MYVYLSFTSLTPYMMLVFFLCDFGCYLKMRIVCVHEHRSRYSMHRQSIAERNSKTASVHIQCMRLYTSDNTTHISFEALNINLEPLSPIYCERVRFTRRRGISRIIIASLV